jgi:hypothetical protein
MRGRSLIPGIIVLAPARNFFGNLFFNPVRWGPQRHEMGESKCVNSARTTLSRRRVLGIVPAVLCQACQWERKKDAPTITFTRIPQADPKIGTQRYY